MSFLLLAYITLCSNFASASELIRFAGKVQSPSEILRFVEKTKNDFIGNDQLSCVSIPNIQNTVLCLSTSDFNLDQYFARASAFIEGDKDIKIGTVLGQSDPRLPIYYLGAAGYDLKSAAIEGFKAEVFAECKINKDFCFSDKESALINFLAKEKSPIIIALSLDDSVLVEHISHEVLHALYFSNSKYHQVLEKYWQEHIHPADKQGITWFLSNQYDVTDFNLVLNEFFAYLLMKPISRSLLSGYLPEHRAMLYDTITAAGLRVWLFNEDPPTNK